MRPVDPGVVPRDGNGQPVRYQAYIQARRDLIQRLGGYCSYCEMKLDAGLAVEHIRPKSRHPDLEKAWHNFLLACPNCNATKADKDPAFTSLLWPHKDNTLRALQYKEQGRITPAPDLPPELVSKAQASIKLTGLDKNPDTAKASDRRWLGRRDAWNTAMESLENLKACDCEPMRDQIIRTALGCGYWSIWMTVFAEDGDLRRRLIRALPGTAQDCFDNEGAAVPRPGGQL